MINVISPPVVYIQPNTYAIRPITDNKPVINTMAIRRESLRNEYRRWLVVRLGVLLSGWQVQCPLLYLLS